MSAFETRAIRAAHHPKPKLPFKPIVIPLYSPS